MSFLRPAIIGGFFLIFVAFFANYLGLDNNSAWGPRRYLVFIVGLFFLNLGKLSKIVIKRSEKLLNPALNQLRGSIKISDTKKNALLTILAIGIVFIIYFWYGAPNHKNHNSIYYAKLATAFKQGHLYLDKKPSEALLSMQNPYNYEKRVALGADDSLWDVSFYDQKFYLYWGPVPGILLMPIGFETLEHLGDQWLVYSFLAGLLIYSSLIGYQLWQNNNKKIPAWLLPLTLLVIGLSPPLLWILNSARIYEAAIIGSQFFFIGGCYWAYLALKREKIRSLELLLVSIHWALALGTRLTLLPSIMLASFILLIHIYQHTKTKKGISIKHLILNLALPILVAGILLAWYNWQRFDSVFESGVTYILTTEDFTKAKPLFAISNIKENLKNYFYYPVIHQSRFPYIRPTENIFSNERMAGIIFTSPFLVFFSFSLKWLFSKRNTIKEIAEKRIALIFLGSSLISLSIILTFYFPTARYAAEFTTPLLLLAMINLRQIPKIFQPIPNDYYPFVALMGILTVALSILITIPPEQSSQVINLTKNLIGR